MRLTLHTDYAMRVLMHLAAEPDSQTSIAEIAKAHGVSRNHLMKVVMNLAKAGLVTSTRGRSGGIRLGRPAEAITVGDVVRQTEDGFALVDCSGCLIAGACELPAVLNQATRAFLAVLDSHTIADMLRRRLELATILRPPGPSPKRAPRPRAVENPDVPCLSLAPA